MHEAGKRGLTMVSSSTSNAVGQARGAGRSFGTRGRLVLAFAILAASVAAAFGFQLARLAAMQSEIVELREDHEQMRLTLELSDAVRDGYGQPGPTRFEEERRIRSHMRRLAAEVDEPEARSWVERLSTATDALERRSRAERTELAAGRPPPQGTEEARRALVFEVEHSADRLFTFLRERSLAQSAAVEDRWRRTLQLALGFAIVLPLFALAIGVYLSRAIGGPLALLGEGAARIGAGDLRTRIELQGQDELSVLAARFNAMAAALEQHQERLVRSEKLASLGRVAAGVAHEINNPLQVILGYLSLHRGRVEGELGQHLARVEREAVRCGEIVEAMLQLSRPSPTTPPEPVDLRQLSQEVVEAVRAVMPEAPEVRVAGAGDALGSAARYRQVLFNLVKNAAEAAGPAGRVDVAVECDREVARVVVSDTGPGIPPDLRARVFEPFFTTKSTGTGLGLALARAIAQAHGGDVELQDAAAGTRFCLRAPRGLGGMWT